MLVREKNYSDVNHRHTEEGHIFLYRTGLTAYNEEFRGGSLFGAGWNTGGFPIKIDSRNSRTKPEDYMIEPAAFHLEINGRCADYGYELVDFTSEKSDHGIHSALKLKNTHFPINLTVHTEIDGTQTISRYMEIQNCSEEPLCLSRIGLFNNILDFIDKTDGSYRPNILGEKGMKVDDFYSAGYFADAGWAAEGEFAWHPLEPNVEKTVDMRYYHSKFRHPLLFLRDNVRGKIWFCQVAWSAGVKFQIEHLGHQGWPYSALSLNVEIAAHNPMLVLRGGEIYTLPEIVIGAVQGDLDDAVNLMHAHTRKHYMPEADPTSCLVIGSMGASCDMSVETTKERIRRFAELGAEIFMIDAGWQCPPDREREHRKFNGTNRPDPDRYPNGVKEIADYCHEHGMKLGFWTEVERLGELAPVYSEHPEWQPSSMWGGKYANYLDMSNPDAAAWAESEFDAIIKECHLDVLRIDHINPCSAHFVMGDTGSGVTECLSMRHYKAVYEMYERLKLRYPHMIFENCAGGGGRTDLGIMKYFNHTWVTDNQVMPRAEMITNGMTLALPPEKVDRLFSSMSNHIHGSFDANVRNAMLTHMSFGAFGDNDIEYSPIQVEFAKHSIEIYKNFIRPILPTAYIYHHTPEAKKCMESGEYILEIASPDGSRGAATVMLLTFTPEKTLTFKPKGVDVGRKYRVTLDNTRSSFIMEGSELKMRGLEIYIPSALSSELVLFEAID